MLSYRHAFHAGNHADVLKHLVLIEILRHLGRKDAPFDYLDTHSGGGLFALDAAETASLQEYKSGIARIYGSDEPALAPYLETVKAFNAGSSLSVYPGSPAIATHWLRPQDKAWLCELHPADHKSLVANLRGHRNVRVAREDGFAKLKALMPPASRRAAVLIDPSYEIKSDYDGVVDAIAGAYRKFPSGTYALWYPVVERVRVERLERRVADSGLRNVQQFELGIAPDTDAKGMTASGMIVVNPPWTLLDTLQPLLPTLAGALADGAGHSRCAVLVPE